MSSYIRKKTPGDTQWFVHDRFGMFIHFGLYAMPARHEWVMTREQMSQEQYQKYFERFDRISVKEVAYNLGFCDEYHFSKQFSKRIGVSPLKYKKGVRTINNKEEK